MSLIFSYRPIGGNTNEGQFFKLGLAKPTYSIDFTSGLNSGVSISTVGVVALNAGNGTVTSTCIGTVSTSSNVTTISVLTCGTAGATAADGERFKFTATATCSNGESLIYETFVLIQSPTYDPT